MLLRLSFIAVLFAAIFCGSALPLKVLILATSHFHSHLGFNVAIARTLTKAGHYVHFVVLDCLPKPLEKPIEISGNATISYYRPIMESRDAFAKTLADYHFSDPINMFGRRFYWIDEPLYQQVNLLLQPFSDFVKDEAFLNKLRTEKFNVGLAEFVDPLAFATFHQLGISTTVVTTSFGLYSILIKYFGVPHPIGHPEADSTPLEGLEMGIWPRANNWYLLLRSNWYFEEGLNQVDKFMTDNFGTNFPTYFELTQRTSYLFVNMNELLDIARPISPKMKFIGGIAAAELLASSESKRLDANVQQIFDKAKTGVVLFSFGSVVSVELMSREMRNVFIEALSAFPNFEFIWRLPNASSNELEVFGQHSNIHPLDWVPQVAILSHPKTKAFITHCGLNSINEAVNAGVPMLGIPLFGDQYYNAVMIKHRRIAKVLDKMSISKSSLMDALEGLLSPHENIYTNNVRRLRQKIQAAPFSPNEVLVRHIEFAAQFDDGLPELCLPGARLSFVTYYGLNIVLIAIVLFLITTLLIVWLLTMFAKTIFHQKSKLKMKKHFE